MSVTSSEFHLLPKAKGSERGLHDAECMRRFLQQSLSGEIKHRIYYLNEPESAEAHDAFVVGMNIAPVDESVDMPESDGVEQMYADERCELLRQMVVHSSGVTVCYYGTVR